MFFLYDMFHDKNSVSTIGNSVEYDTAIISNGIFSHFNIKNVIEISSEPMAFSYTEPSLWTASTIINISFNGTVNAGDISDLIEYVDHLEIQRKEGGANSSNEWITLQRITKNTQTQILNTNFTLYDSYAKDNTIYTYQIVPYDDLGRKGVLMQQEILSMFDDIYILDAEEQFKITYENHISNSSFIQKSAKYEPYGAELPFVVYNAKTRYTSQTVTAILLAPSNENGLTGYLDRHAQTELVNKFNYWLANGKAKILKDFNGNLKIGAIINPISNDYYRELGNGLASTTFEFVEVGKMTQSDLDKLGLSNKFIVEYRQS